MLIPNFSVVIKKSAEASTLVYTPSLKCFRIVKAVWCAPSFRLHSDQIRWSAETLQGCPLSFNQPLYVTGQCVLAC